VTAPRARTLGPIGLHQKGREEVEVVVAAHRRAAEAELPGGLRIVNAGIGLVERGADLAPRGSSRVAASDIVASRGCFHDFSIGPPGTQALQGRGRRMAANETGRSSAVR
jgi:hypothetical protein